MADADFTELAEALEDWEEVERQKRREAIYERPKFQGLQVDPEIDFYPEVADREPGDTNIEGYGFDLHPQVTFWSAGLLAVIILYALIWPDQSQDAFREIRSFAFENFGWLFVLAVNLYLLIAVYFAFSRYGKIRIGGPTAQTEFSTPAWIAMLISAGIGIGLLYYGVAEPIYHLGSPPPVFGTDANAIADGYSAVEYSARETLRTSLQEGTTSLAISRATEGLQAIEAAGTATANQAQIDAAKAAFATTYLHWGIHAWAIYGLVAVALAFFAYNRGLPLTFRSLFYPLLRERIYGWWGNIIDILTILATLFGLATSLGLGARSVAGGLNYLFDTPTDVWFQILIIAFITGIATMSVVAGLDGGVKRLSSINIGMAVVLLIFVLVFGSTLFLLSMFTQSIGSYLQVLPEFGWWAEALTGTIADTSWQGGWTVFYWAWWIAWSPFVGMFVARVSKGRSVREMIFGVVLLPSVLVFFWFSIFGGQAFHFQFTGERDMVAAVLGNFDTALFEMLKSFPLTGLVTFFTVLLIVTFFVTSSDSGSLVVDHLTSGGKLDSPKPQRVFWAIMEGMVASVLLVAGGASGLTALQAVTTASALPFVFILFIMCWSMYKAFDEELDLLEDHYDLQQFKSHHSGLIEHLSEQEEMQKA